MNNKGFTLIELTAVIVVMSVIFLVAFPNILNLGKEKEEEQYNGFVNDLCMAGESYIYANIDSFEELSTVGGQIEIQVQNLIESKYIDKNLKNPKNNSLVENDSLIYSVLIDNSLSCEYKEN